MLAGCRPKRRTSHSNLRGGGAAAFGGDWAVSRAGWRLVFVLLFLFSLQDFPRVFDDSPHLLLKQVPVVLLQVAAGHLQNKNTQQHFFHLSLQSTVRFFL